MTTKEAINRIEDHKKDALDMDIAALRAHQSPAKLDRSRWEGCETCKGGRYRRGEYCPGCGNPLTEEAWAELERRIGGGTIMTTKELAEMLSGREHCTEMTKDERRQAAEAGLTVVYGYSDEKVELAGAIDAEVWAWGGTTVYLTRDGIFFDPDICHKSSCPHYLAAREKARTIKAVWHDEGGPCWTFETDIPHETFNIYDDGELFSVGVVFRMEDLYCGLRLMPTDQKNTEN